MNNPEKLAIYGTQDEEKQFFIHFCIYLLLVSNNKIIIKTNVLLSQAYMCVTLAYFVYPFYVHWFYCFRTHLSCLAFQSFDFGKHLELGRNDEWYSRT